MQQKSFSFSILFFFFSFLLNAQMTTHTTIYAGYEYQKQSFADIGVRFLFLKNDDFIYRIGAGSLLGTSGGKLGVLPKLQADILINTQRNVDIHHSYYFLAGAELTSKFIAPKIGASLFGLVDISACYGFSLDENRWKGKEMNGLNINFTLNIPLVVFQK
jgi:hypothetical protein